MRTFAHNEEGLSRALLRIQVSHVLRWKTTLHFYPDEDLDRSRLRPRYRLLNLHCLLDETLFCVSALKVDLGAATVWVFDDDLVLLAGVLTVHAEGRKLQELRVLGRELPRLENCVY